jgi:hypothetical protein
MNNLSELNAQLNHYLPEVLMIELRLAMSTPKDIGICLTVARIIKDFNSDQATEDRVSELLSELLKIHFS